MYKTYLRLIFVLLLSIQLTSCITARKVNYLQQPDHTIPAYNETHRYEEYRLRVGDKLYVKVYSTHEETNKILNSPYVQSNISGINAENSRMDLYSYQIQDNGCILFPMVGNVKVGGMTVREATEVLEKAIEPVYKFSSVELKILGRYFSVIGGKRTGFYPIQKEKINIFQALAMAGDVELYGDRSKVRIVRETEHGTEVRTFDLRSKDILDSEYYYVEPNDVIYIQTLNEQFFSVANFPTLIATVLSTFSFGIFLYNIIFTPVSQ